MSDPAAIRRMHLNIAGGSRICVPAVIDQITPYVLLEQEDWFEDEIRFVRRWLRPGMQAIDAGASFGTYSLAIARAIGPQGRLWSYEPTPATAGYLRETLAMNACPQVEQRQAAVSDRPGRIAMAASHQSELNAVAATGQGIEVEAITLDGEAARAGITALDFIKLDVEGHEAAAIAGGERLLTGASPLVMLEVKAHATADLSVLAPLAALGLQFYRLLPGPLLLVPFDEAEPVDEYLLNLFACRPERAATLAAAGVLAEHTGETGVAPVEPWQAMRSGAAYARAFDKDWPGKPGFFAGAGEKSHFRALAAYACARDERRPTAERAGWLAAAFGESSDALADRDSVSRRLSFARIAADTGFRAQAVYALEPLLARHADEADSVLREPFLAPMARYEAIAAERPADWLACAVRESYDQLRHRTSVFTPDASLAVLEPIAGLPLRSAQTERRRQLSRMFRGLQRGFQPSPLLRERSEENLNPDIWSGAADVVLGTSPESAAP